MSFLHPYFPNLLYSLSPSYYPYSHSPYYLLTTPTTPATPTTPTTPTPTPAPRPVHVERRGEICSGDGAALDGKEGV